MTCPKCAARMFAEPSVHYLSSSEYTVDQTDTKGQCEALHCLLCGTWVDAVIVANRAKQADERRLVAQAETIATWASLGARQGVRS